MTTLTIWHNNVGRPIPCLGLPNGYAGRGGISPFSVDTPESTATAAREWVHTVERYGAAIVTDSRHIRPANHHIIGCGGGHDDANWCESRFLEGSQEAWRENEMATVYHGDKLKVVTGVLELRLNGKGS